MFGVHLNDYSCVIANLFVFSEARVQRQPPVRRSYGKRKTRRKKRERRRRSLQVLHPAMSPPIPQTLTGFFFCVIR